MAKCVQFREAQVRQVEEGGQMKVKKVEVEESD